uniref:Calphotin-like n=1 Tax=Diabrotica virgifera virgifera TaxID=50390 RepID=A0A6P7FA08_DIAVI
MSFKTVTLLLLAFATFQIECSVIPFRYTQIAPPNIRPFAAQVSTFTRGLNVLAAPLAAGVLNPPAIVTRNIVPGLPFTDPVALPAPVAAPLVHAHSPVVSAPFAAPAVFPAPAAFSAPFAAPVAPVGVIPGPPAHVLPVPNARSVHAVAPAAAPVLW